MAKTETVMDSQIEMGLENMIAQFSREAGVPTGIMQAAGWMEALSYMEMTGNTAEVLAARTLKSGLQAGINKTALEAGLPEPPQVPRVDRPDLFPEEL